MTLDQIDAFLAVNECGNFSRASKQLHLTESALSHRVVELEKELGFTLFNRGKGIRVVSLTKEGISFLPLAEEWRRIWQGAINISKDDVRDELTVCAVHSLHACILPDLIRLFGARDLPVYLFLKSSNSNDAFYDVASGDDDIALLNIVSESRSVISELVARERIVMVSNPSSSYGPLVSVDQIDSDKEVMIDRNPMTNLWRSRWFHADSSRGKVRIESTSMLPSLLSGLGDTAWALVPLSVARDLEFGTGLHVSELDHPAPAREIWMTSNRSTNERWRTVFLEDLRAALAGRDGIELVE